MSRVANITGRIFSPNLVTASNELGGARMMNATDILNDIDANRTDRLMETDQVNKDIRNLLSDHYTLKAKTTSNSAFFEKTIGDSVEKAMPSKDDVWRLADQKAYADRLNAERAVQAPTPDAVATPLASCLQGDDIRISQTDGWDSYGTQRSGLGHGIRDRP